LNDQYKEFRKNLSSNAFLFLEYSSLEVSVYIRVIFFVALGETFRKRFFQDWGNVSISSVRNGPSKRAGLVTAVGRSVDGLRLLLPHHEAAVGGAALCSCVEGGRPAKEGGVGGCFETASDIFFAFSRKNQFAKFRLVNRIFTSRVTSVLSLKQEYVAYTTHLMQCFSM